MFFKSIKACSQQKMECHVVCQCIAQIYLTDLTGVTKPYPMSWRGICKNMIKNHWVVDLFHLPWGHSTHVHIHFTQIWWISFTTWLPEGNQLRFEHGFSFQVGCHKKSHFVFLKIVSYFKLVATKHKVVAINKPVCFFNMVSPSNCLFFISSWLSQNIPFSSWK